MGREDGGREERGREAERWIGEEDGVGILGFWLWIVGRGLGKWFWESGQRNADFYRRAAHFGPRHARV